MKSRSTITGRVNPSRLVPAVGDPVSTLWRRLFQGTRLTRRAPDWDRFAGEGWEARIMDEPVTDRLHQKQGRTIGRRIFSNANEQLVVYLKRHYRLAWWRGILATLFPERAWSPGLQEWQHLIWAAQQGLPVPRPVAAGQTVGPGFRLHGFLAVEELQGMLPLHEAVPLAADRLDANTFLRWKRGLTIELARLARELHLRNVFHKDLYFCHFYIPESFTRQEPPNWMNRMVMIDLHRLARHSVIAPWWQAKDLAQLLYSSAVPGVTARDRLRFWKHYHLGSPRRRSGWLLPIVRWKSQLYERNARRRANQE